MWKSGADRCAVEISKNQIFHPEETESPENPGWKVGLEGFAEGCQITATVINRSDALG